MPDLLKSSLPAAASCKPPPLAPYQHYCKAVMDFLYTRQAPVDKLTA